MEALYTQAKVYKKKRLAHDHHDIQYRKLFRSRSQAVVEDEQPVVLTIPA